MSARQLIVVVEASDFEDAVAFYGDALGLPAALNPESENNAHVVILDATVAPLLARVLPELTTIKHIVVANGPKEAIEAPAGIEVHSYDELLAG